MSKLKIALIVGLALILIGCCTISGVFMWGLGTLNEEASVLALVQAKQKDNQNQYDNCWKSVAQASQVTEAQAKAITKLVIDYAEARGGVGKGGGMISANTVHEVVPNMDTKSFEQLMNIVVAKRDVFAYNQKMLLDLQMQHNKMFHIYPGALVLSVFGRKEVDVQIVTSTRTDNAFTSGKDDDTSVFQKSGAK